MLIAGYDSMGTEAPTAPETDLEKHTVKERTREGCQP